MHKQGVSENRFYPMAKVNEIFRTSDEHGNIIIYELNKFRMMTFDSSSEQSKIRIGDPMFLDHEYIQAMLLPLLHINPKHVTLLGLGGGSLASCLYYVYFDVKLVAVEWRKAVIDIAYDYFYLPRDERLEVNHNEAGSWMEYSEDQSTDLILSDLFHALGVNEIQLENNFFENCHRTLRDTGWLVLNYHVKPKAESSALNHLCQLFPAIFTLQVNSGNWVLLASKQELTLQAMMTPTPNNNLPIMLASNLRLLQGRLLKVSTNNWKKT
jgi:spermidine synthase